MSSAISLCISANFSALIGSDSNMLMLSSSAENIRTLSSSFVIPLFSVPGCCETVSHAAVADMGGVDNVSVVEPSC